MVKEYITWNRFWMESYRAVDPDMQIEKLWPQVTFISLPYGEQGNDKRRLAIIEYVDGALSSNAWAKFIKNFNHFTFHEITALEAKNLCNEWYSPPSGQEFTLDTDNFTIVDNRTE